MSGAYKKQRQKVTASRRRLISDGARKDMDRVITARSVQKANFLPPSLLFLQTNQYSGTYRVFLWGLGLGVVIVALSHAILSLTLAYMTSVDGRLITSPDLHLSSQFS